MICRSSFSTARATHASRDRVAMAGQQLNWRGVLRRLHEPGLAHRLARALQEQSTLRVLLHHAVVVMITRLLLQWQSLLIPVLPPAAWETS